MIILFSLFLLVVVFLLSFYVFTKKVTVDEINYHTLQGLIAVHPQFRSKNKIKNTQSFPIIYFPLGFDPKQIDSNKRKEKRKRNRSSCLTRLAYWGPTQRERERGTDRQTETGTERNRDGGKSVLRERERQRDRERDRDRERQRERVLLLLEH